MEARWVGDEGVRGEPLKPWRCCWKRTRRKKKRWRRSGALVLTEKVWEWWCMENNTRSLHCWKSPFLCFTCFPEFTLCIAAPPLPLSLLGPSSSHLLVAIIPYPVLTHKTIVMHHHSSTSKCAQHNQHWCITYKTLPEKNYAFPKSIL